MDYYIIAMPYHTHIGKQLKKPPSWWPIGPERESKYESPTAYHFATREQAQEYLDANKPADEDWTIFFIKDDDYANF